jgi:two-component system, sensor histidine kinase and response regulator
VKRENEDKVNILIVDDREEKLLALGATLEVLNQNVVKARSGREALRELLQRDFAVILLDVTMPVMDGYETADLIRQRPQTQHTPIIFVTAASQSDNDVFKGYALGAVDYIVSPIIPEILRSKVSVFIELYKRTQEVRRQSECLAEINRELESFSYSIAHDLRAPLRSIQSFAEILCDECGSTLNDNGKNYLHRIIQSSKTMDRLLLDILEYSRMTRAQSPLSAVNLEQTVDQLLDDLKANLDDKKARVEVNRPVAGVVAHGPTLRQCIANITENALKFVPRGKPPQIRIWTEKQNGTVKIWIEDNGIGIASEHCEKLFKLFERLHSSQEYPGTGIGLAIVQKGVERMGGRVGVESELQVGSRFWIELPGALEVATGC